MYKHRKLRKLQWDTSATLRMRHHSVRHLEQLEHAVQERLKLCHTALWDALQTRHMTLMLTLPMHLWCLLLQTTSALMRSTMRYWVLR